MDGESHRINDPCHFELPEKSGRKYRVWVCHCPQSRCRYVDYNETKIIYYWEEEISPQ